MTKTAKANAARKAKREGHEPARAVRQPAATPAKDMRSEAEQFAAVLRDSVDYEPPPRKEGGFSAADRDLIRMALRRAGMPAHQTLRRPDHALQK